MKKWFQELNGGEKFWVVAIAIAVMFFGLIHTNQVDWSVDSSEEWNAQVFPDSANSKNYELPVDMDISEFRHGFFHSYYQYKVTKAVFPNVGYLEFDDCVARDMQMSICTDQDGKSWGVKVLVTPDKPESDSSSDY